MTEFQIVISLSALSLILLAISFTLFTMYVIGM